MVAACQFGSIHKKVFVFLLHLVESIEVKCLGGHDHVKIEGKWTKASAAYPQDLGVHLAKAFSRAVRRCKRLANDEVSISGFESVVTNDLLVSRKWEFCQMLALEEEKPHQRAGSFLFSFSLGRCRASLS